MLSLVENGSVVLEKNTNMLRVYEDDKDDKDVNDDDRQISIRKANLSRQFR